MGTRDLKLVYTCGGHHEPDERCTEGRLETGGQSPSSSTDVGARTRAQPQRPCSPRAISPLNTTGITVKEEEHFD